jgi:hypothetical protein
MSVRLAAPGWGLVATLVLVVMCAVVAPTAAQPKKKEAPSADVKKDEPTKTEPGKKKEPKVKNFDFNGLDLNGRNRTPQLLYFLERANEELERASLEKRSFIPHMVRSVEEEKL